MQSSFNRKVATALAIGMLVFVVVFGQQLPRLTAGLFVTAQAATNIISTARSADWSTAGASIVNRTTVCSSLTASATAAQINTAIANCLAGQVVSLAAGTYTLTAGLLFQRDNVTLRGAGPNATFLNITATNGCGGITARLCVRGTALNDLDAPGNVANWTAGYAKGTSVITLSSVANLAVGSILILDQLDDGTTDTTTIWIGDTAGVHCLDCSSPSRGGNRAQQQVATVKAISGASVTIDPPVIWPNFTSGKSPQAWYPSNGAARTGVGIENLAIDTPDSGTAIAQTVTFYNATSSWMKNVRMTHVGEKAVRIYQATHITIRDSYIFDKQGSDASQEGSESYGVDVFMGSLNLIENNIAEHITSPLMCESGVANVYAYNYTRDDFYKVSDTSWAQASSYNHGVCAYNLYEGNHGFGFISDVVHSSNYFHTNFRNRYEGWESPRTLQTVPIHIYAANRYQNVVGNVLGTNSYHTRYESFPTDATNCNRSIYALGWGGNCGGGGGIANKPDTRATLFRWGNYDTVNDASRFVVTEVPSAGANYPNAVPSDNLLPSSLYLPAKPAYFGSMPWPAIGPDVTGGPDASVGGHAHKIPALACYDSTPKVSGILAFNGATCYPTSGTPPVPPGAPTNLRITGA